MCLVIFWVNGVNISIQNFHFVKFLFPYSHNYYWNGKSAATNYLVDRFLEITNSSIRQKQNHLEFLIFLITWLHFVYPIHIVKNFTEISWTIKRNILQCFFVTLNYFLKSIHSRVKYISIKG
jgi:hypothetical protein